MEGQDLDPESDLRHRTVKKNQETVLVPIPLAAQLYIDSATQQASIPHYPTSNRLADPPSLEERFEEFKSTHFWKCISPFLRPIPLILILTGLFLCHVLLDFEVIKDAEAYGVKTKCYKPLILFKDSSIRFHKAIKRIDPKNPDYQELNEALKVSTCYLQVYAKNISCITPLAYGIDLRIISLRNKRGDIIHLINPGNPTMEDKYVSLYESNSLFPDKPPVLVSRPKHITIEYLSHDLNAAQLGKFELANSFCIRSSLDLFDYKIAQYS